MAELCAVGIAEVVEACRSGMGEASAALGRALDGQGALSVGDPRPAAAARLTEVLDEPGLAVVFGSGDQSGVVLIPQSSGILPDWCPHPDATGQSKLDTLAQELAMLLLPDALPPSDFRASYVANLARAVGRGMPGEGASVVPLLWTTASAPATTLHFVWPIVKPQAVIGAGQGKPAATTKTASEAGGRPTPSLGQVAASPSRPARRPPASVRELPQYARSLLRIRLPVVVTLTRKKQAFGRVVELGPGAIIQFDKSCEEMLDLEVGGLKVAVGEAVKVGDKFGLRITSIVLPEERFRPVPPARSSVRGS